MRFCEEREIRWQGRLRRIEFDRTVLEWRRMGRVFAFVTRAGAASGRPYGENSPASEIANFKFEISDDRKDKGKCRSLTLNDAFGMTAKSQPRKRSRRDGLGAVAVGQADFAAAFGLVVAAAVFFGFED